MKTRTPLALAALLLMLVLVAACNNVSKLDEPVGLSHAGKLKTYKYDVNVVSSSQEMPQPLLDTLKADLEKVLAERHMLHAGKDTNVLRLDVDVNYYRMRSGATKFFLGALAGRDGIDSEIKLRAPSGDKIGKAAIQTSNLTVLMSPEEVARMHAEAIADFLRKG